MACRAPLLLLISLALLSPLVHAVIYDVGEKDGWVTKPSQGYQQWSDKNKFYVNDWLVFHYKQGEDSALQVTKEGFDQCNLKSPLRYMGSGQSVFVLEKPGTYYFISGAKGHCQSGQKVEVVVAAQPKPPVPSPSPSPAVPSHPPSHPPKSAPPHSPAVDVPAPSKLPEKAPAPSPDHKSAASSLSLVSALSLGIIGCISMLLFV